MWEVSDGDSKVWLFGSMHLVPPGTEWRTALFDETLAKADKVYFEADVGPWGILGATIWMLKSGFNNAQHPWLPTLTADETQKLTDAITPLGMKLDSLGAYEPWLAAMLIEQKALEVPTAGSTTPAAKTVAGPDMVVEGELVPERKAYFETVAQQLNMMSALPRDQQITSLMATLDDLHGSSGQLDAMTSDWSTGNTDALIKLIASDPETSGAMADTMLYGRNRNWIPVIDGMLKQNQQDLIIVGAAHLVGDGSVTDLLSKAGFTVTRI